VRLNRGYYCSFCEKQYSRLKGHLFDRHAEEVSVKKLLMSAVKDTQKKILGEL
jgi:hypothetical protein